MAKKELFKDLVSLGKKQGYLTYEEINKKVAEKDLTSDKIDNLFIRLAELGIKIADKNSASSSVSSSSSTKKEKNLPTDLFCFSPSKNYTTEFFFYF